MLNNFLSILSPEFIQKKYAAKILEIRQKNQVAQRATIAHLSDPIHPNDATHKIGSRLANWLQRCSSSKVWNFRQSSNASNSKMSGLIWPKIELDQAFMLVLVTSNFDDDSIKNEWASMEIAFSHYKSMVCKYKNDQIKSNREMVETPFSPL